MDNFDQQFLIVISKYLMLETMFLDKDTNNDLTYKDISDLNNLKKELATFKYSGKNPEKLKEIEKEIETLLNNK
jgi:hypothetical protein